MIRKWVIRREGVEKVASDFGEAIKLAMSMTEQGDDVDTNAYKKEITITPCPHTHYVAMFAFERGPMGDMIEVLVGYRCGECDRILEEMR